MLANDMLVIIKKGKDFCVHLNFCVDNPFRASKDNLIKKFKTLAEAIKFANKYCNDELVEYGVHISDNCLKSKCKSKCIDGHNCPRKAVIKGYCTIHFKKTNGGKK